MNQGPQVTEESPATVMNQDPQEIEESPATVMNRDPQVTEESLATPGLPNPVDTTTPADSGSNYLGLETVSDSEILSMWQAFSSIFIPQRSRGDSTKQWQRFRPLRFRVVYVKYYELYTIGRGSILTNFD